MAHDASVLRSDPLVPPAPDPPAVPAVTYLLGHVVLVPLLIGGLAAWVEYGALDMLVTRLFVDGASQTFPGRASALLDVLGHQAARGLPFLVGGVALAAGLAGTRLDALRPWRQLLLTLGAAMVLGPLAVNLLKGMTTQHCPSALQLFGGVVDYAVERAGPFWAQSRAAAGHCLPSGHAGGGYALVALYFAGWAAGRPAWRWRGLALGIAAGLLFSVVRLMQGAHFASATLWSAAVDWAICAVLFFPLLCRSKRAVA